MVEKKWFKIIIGVISDSGLLLHNIGIFYHERCRKSHFIAKRRNKNHLSVQYAVK